MNDALCRMVKQARIRKGLTQEQVGDMIYLSGNGYGKAERGERDLTTEQTVKLCRHLGIPVGDMLAAIDDGFEPAPEENSERGTEEVDSCKMRAGQGGWSVMDGTKLVMADFLVKHVDYVCLAAGLDYYDGNTEIENLARLLCEVMLSGDKPVVSPVRRTADAFDGVLSGYGLSAELQDKAASIAMDLVAYWDGCRELPLRKVIANIMWHTDFEAIAPCPGYFREIQALREAFAQEIGDADSERNKDVARRSRIILPFRPGQILKFHAMRSGRCQADEYEYCVLVEKSGAGVSGRRAENWMVVTLHRRDGHTLLNTAMGTPFVEAHVTGGEAEGTWYADTCLVYRLDNQRVYDVVGEVDKPALDVIRDMVSAQFKERAAKDERLDGAGYGSCIQYRFKGELRRGIISYIDDRHEKARLLDVFFLMEQEAAADPGYVRLSKDTRDADGELFYKTVFPENMHPYLRRGSVTVFEHIREDVSEVRRLGSWPSRADTNERVRDLSEILGIGLVPGSAEDAEAGPDVPAPHDGLHENDEP